MIDISKKIKLNALRVIMTILTVGLIAWIFSNSLKNATDSTVQSSNAMGILQSVLNVLCFGHAPELSSHFVRKLAHFTEYAMLGFMLYLTFLSYTTKRKLIFIPLIIGFIIPFCDEGLQHFSEGRSPQITDVMIDSSGMIVGFFFTFLIVLLISYLIKKHKDKVEN